MKIDVLTLFPEMVEPFFHTSIIGKANEKDIVQCQAINFRSFSTNKHQTVDDYPYGGGGGMVLKPEPIFAAVSALQQQALPSSHPEDVQHQPKVILMCPQGETFTQQKAEQLAKEDHLIFICGHYEGYDERIREHLVTDELSIGDYVLTGGELPAMVVIDSVVRLLPGTLGNEQSAVTDSFSTGLLEYPHYTRPASYEGMDVPSVLLSGHHENIETWRKKEALRRTWQRRRDLLEGKELTNEERKWIKEFQQHNK
ncbi:tRNA (guanosine(37)-N1)-methyltransferase TrmD [Longirhabdus pacifica]|uniref:tRNA (guanosine(37)-N1)-methyltransferase TrmD n=1 Tax=Longirhabdus pacifica TaxID=2305227 RepID=UPI0010091357|nr:tRNA (guanosine(37)-N1)-methyltransferase TrmD [Longirhabdus pacifica]